MISLLSNVIIRTKSFVFFFILIVLLVLFSGTKVYSQATQCYPDCPSSLWIPNPPSPAYTYVLTLPCGSNVTVYYRIRNACNEWWDLFIESVQFNGGFIDGVNCGYTMSVTDMIQNITQQLLVQNPMNFPPAGSGPDSCILNFRCTYSACWFSTFPVSYGRAQRNSSLGINDTIGNNQNIQPEGVEAWLQPCSSLLCCLQVYKVCRENNQRIITYLPEYSDPGVCDPNSPNNCQPVCE
jgi:hypothetical protein